jgi:hypothetical protein
MRFHSDQTHQQDMLLVNTMSDLVCVSIRKIFEGTKCCLFANSAYVLEFVTLLNETIILNEMVRAAVLTCYKGNGQGRCADLLQGKWSGPLC